jgi:hypothetical protein
MAEEQLLTTVQNILQMGWPATITITFVYLWKGYKAEIRLLREENAKRTDEFIAVLKGVSEARRKTDELVKAALKGGDANGF